LVVAGVGGLVGVLDDLDADRLRIIHLPAPAGLLGDGVVERGKERHEGGEVEECDQRQRAPEAAVLRDGRQENAPCGIEHAEHRLALRPIDIDGRTCRDGLSLAQRSIGLSCSIQ